MNSSADWRDFSSDGNTVPDSCCINVTKSCGKGAMLDANKVYQKVKPPFADTYKVLSSELKRSLIAFLEWMVYRL